MGKDSATDLKPIDAAKVRAIASRLTSDHDGEVVAAARALVRIAAAAGKRVEDLFTVVPVADLSASRDWFRKMQAAGEREFMSRRSRMNWKFIVDGLCLVGRSGLLNLSDQAMLSVVNRKMDESPGWTPPPKFAAHILELARRHGIVAA